MAYSDFENGTVVGSDGYTTPADLNGDGTFDFLQSSFSPCKELYPSVDNAEFAIGKTIDDITFQFGKFLGSFTVQDFTWKEWWISIIPDGPFDVFAADMDGDGDMDVVATYYLSGKIMWYENNGGANPGWNGETGANIATGVDDVRTVFVEDMDGDGDLDIVSASFNDNTIAWYENDGNADPSWTAADIASTAEDSRNVFAADMDGDGDMDTVSYTHLTLPTIA